MSRKTGIDRFISPAVLNGYCEEVDESGVIFRSLAGIDGVIVNGCIETDEIPKDTKQVAVFVAVENRDGSGKSERLTTPKGEGEVATEVPVSSRSKITISTDCVGAKGVWVAIAIRPNATGKFMQRIEYDEPRVSLPARAKAVTRRN